MADETTRIVSGHRFLQALGEAGIISVSDKVRRVVIDAGLDSPVVVHVERYGDERLLNVVQTLDGIEVHCGESGG